MSNNPKKLIRFDNKDYIWHKGNWTTLNNMTVNTSLAQKLMEYSLRKGLLSREDFVSEESLKDYQEITKTEEDFENND